jgi:CDP-diglyceride synthetase
MASKAAKIWKRTWVGLLLVGALALLLKLAFDSTDGLVVWGAGLLISLGAVYEVGRMQKLATPGLAWILFAALGCSALPGLSMFAGFSLPELGDLASPAGVPISYGLALAVSTALGLLFARLRLGFLLFCAVWCLVPLPALWRIWHDFHAQGLTALLLLSKIGDVLGYYFGSAIGKSHPFPKLSPGKTTAGCVASLVGGTIAGAACVWWGLLPGGRGVAALLAGLAAGAVVNLAAQAGDLLESKVKRAAGVKDSGTWFGPSGGVLDLVDSLLLSVPAALVFWPLLFS